MPVDHINIQHPDRFSLESDRFRDSVENEKLRVELKQTRIYHDLLSNNLSAIFNRIECGETAELHYPDGRVFVISGKERK